MANVAAGSLDSLVLHARSVPLPAISDSGWAYVRVVKSALLTVKSVTPAGTPVPGAELTYSVLVANGGLEQAAGVTVVDSLPVEVEFKVGSANAILPAGVSVVVSYSTDGSNWGYARHPRGAARTRATTAACGTSAGCSSSRWARPRPTTAPR